MEQNFETLLIKNLTEYLLPKGAIDIPLPDCPDVQDKWQSIAEAYLPDGIREFSQYPAASLGWPMLIGMAMATFWDDEWNIYSNIPDVYAYLRNKRGFDQMDEYILEEVLKLDNQQKQHVSQLASDCAAYTLAFMRRQNIEPATSQAFKAYVSCIHAMYLMGMAIQLKTLGYKMTKTEI